MHLRNRSGVMHKRWFFKHTRMHVHTSMSTKHCRPSYNATKIMNTFTCDPDIQQATLCNDSTLLYLPSSLVDGQWHNGETLFSFCFHKKLAHATPNYRLVPPNTMSWTTEMDKKQTHELFNNQIHENNVLEPILTSNNKLHTKRNACWNKENENPSPRNDTMRNVDIELMWRQTEPTSSRVERKNAPSNVLTPSLKLLKLTTNCTGTAQTSVATSRLSVVSIHIM